MAYDAKDAKPRELFSLESEQVVLGAILFDNDVYHRVADFLRTEHFFDPVHQLIFHGAADLIAQGKKVSPAILDASLAASSGYVDAGGRDYLGRMAANVPSISGAGDYARVVADMATRRALVSAAEGMMARARQGDLADEPGSMIAAGEAALRDLADAGRKRKTEWLGAGSDAWFADVETPSAEIPGVSTGLKDLDETVGGLQAGDLVILAGRPSMGKSMLALTIARNVAMAGVGVHMHSIEMERRQLWARLLSDLARDGAAIPYKDLARRRFADDEAQLLRDAHELLKALPFSVDCDSTAIDDICHSSRRAARKFAAKDFRLGVIVVDYLQLVRLDRAYAANPSIAIGLNTKALKNLAKELQCAVVLLCQLNRAVEGREDKRPSMADLRGSGEIEQDADVIGFMLRPEYYLMREDEPDLEELNKARDVLRLFIDKNRNGEIAALRFDCDIACNAARNWGDLRCRMDFGGRP